MRLRSIPILAMTIIGTGLLIGANWVQPKLIWNFSESIPIGLYVIEDRPWVKGDRVAVRPSGSLKSALETAQVLKEGRVLLKRVSAVEGDDACRHGLQVFINGETVATAHPDTRLPDWAGCQRVSEGQVLLLGETPDSFDGRYFGLTDAADVVAAVRLIFPF